MIRNMTRTTIVLQAAVMAMALAPAQSSAQPSAADVTLKSPDGITLKATYYPAAQPGPGLVLLHQCNRDRKAWAAFAQAAAARGYHVIAPDFRGFGESEGERFESFQQQGAIIAEKWPGDVDAAFDWLTSQKGVDKERIAAAGASCGVNEAVLLARRHPQVRSVMLLSGGVTQPGRQYLRQSPSLPVLVAASRDDGDAVEGMRWILGWSRNPANKLVEYQTAGHGTEMFAVEKGLQPLMLNWLDTHVKHASLDRAPTPPGPPSAVETFWTMLTEPGGAAKARQLYDETKKKTPGVVLFPEGELNQHGYQVLQQGNAEEAIIVFQMNVAAYPKSANTYDSLSDAYLAAGKREEALKLAEKALAILAADTRTPEAFKRAIRESAEKKVAELKKK